MLVFNSLEELKPYYHSESNTYVFNDDVTFEFDLFVDSHIKAKDINAHEINAYNINAQNINANDIKAYDINAYDINARDIDAKDILYDAVCFAYENITCTSIEGLGHNHKHFVLDGKITIKPKENKTVTLELTDEQLAKIKEIINEK